MTTKWIVTVGATAVLTLAVVSWLAELGVVLCLVRGCFPAGWV
jgi:hypothetical protein